MHMRLLRLAFGLGAASMLCGCTSPKPQSFVDVQVLPSLFAGREHHAYAIGNKLVVEIHQCPGLNVARIDAFEQVGDLYLSPLRISSGGAGTSRFEADVARYPLPDDWPKHVYWIVDSYAYPLITAGFWSKAKQVPWSRKQIDVAVR